ncbi:MAG: molybdenum cofactor biosynthesis protein MoaE [Methanocorpusculum sp.]|nr:molybdenum cofactor biosynthesis protein MoaE [Methanocorpusculum sp.]
MVTAMQKEDINIAAMINNARKNEDGAQLVFIGTVRDDGNMDALEIEAFTPVAEKDLAEISAEAITTYNLHYADIVHRYGRLSVGENIVAIVVGASHREEAYEGSRFIIEKIKEKVPIWKQELLGEVKGDWVD